MDAHLHPDSASAECSLSTVLEQTGKRAIELLANLQNFTAQERIEYRVLGNMGDQLDYGTGSFDYTAVFDATKRATQCKRDALQNMEASLPAVSQELATRMALIFCLTSKATSK